MGGSDKSKEHKSIFKERELRLWLKLSPKYMSVIANNVSVDDMTLPAIYFFAASQETRHLSRKNIYPWRLETAKLVLAQKGGDIQSLARAIDRSIEHLDLIGGALSSKFIFFSAT